MKYIDFDGVEKEAFTFWEIQASILQNFEDPVWAIEFDSQVGEFYV